MIELHPYSDAAAVSVFQMLDPMDQIEVELTRGAPVTWMALFADWRSMEGVRLVSLVLTDATPVHRPFAVLGLVHTGQAGVAQAALLARSHKRFRRELAAAGLRIRAELPGFAAEHGIQRIEARSWTGHPTANRFLRALGFQLETVMPGFGPDGTHNFNQFAWISPTLIQGEEPCAS